MSRSVPIWCFLISILAKCSRCDLPKPPAIAITISANQFPFISGEIAFYQELTLPADSLSQIIIDFGIVSNGTDNSIGYGILQVHACLYNISLAYNATLEPAYHQTGTNLGLVVARDTKRRGPVTLYVHNFIYHSMINASIAFIPYKRSSPVPGGCSMEQRMQDVPILLLHVDTDITTVDTPLSSNALGACNVPESLSYTGYHLYLNRADYSCRTYFDGLVAMMTVAGLREHGHLGYAAPNQPNRRAYATVPGTGVVFATRVLEASGLEAAYVPAYSAACSPYLWKNNCNVFTGPYFHSLTIFMVVIGIIRAYCGHFLFFVGAAIDGFVLGVYIAFYVMSTYWSDSVVSDQMETGILVGSGMVLAATLTTLWFFIPFIEPVVQMVTNILVGYILAVYTTAFYASMTVQSVGAWFELIFLLCLMVVSLIACGPWMWGSVVLSAAWGTFLIVHGLSLFAGSNWSYMLINTLKFVRVPGYRNVNSAIPIGLEGFGWFVFWIVLFVSAVSTQMWCTGRGDYSPIVDERTPIVTRWTYGSDDVFESPNTNYRFFQRRRLQNRRNHM